MCVSEHAACIGYMVCFRDSECEAFFYNLSRLAAVRCDCILVSPALFIGAFSMIPPCEFSPCKSLTIGPLWWYKGPRIKQGACGSASQRRGEDGVTLTSTKTTLISNTCLCLPRSSLVSPWQHCALFPVAVETLCVRKLQTSLCSGSSLWTHRLKSHLTCRENTISSLCHGLSISVHFTHSHTLSLTGCPWIPRVPPPVSVQVLAWSLAWPSRSWMSSLCLDLKAEINLLFPSSSWHLGPFVFAQ